MAAVHRVMHSVSASIEYVCATTAAANSGPTTSSCTAGNATRPIAATEGASATTAVRTTSDAPGSGISVLRREYSLAAPVFRMTPEAGRRGLGDELGLASGRRGWCAAVRLRFWRHGSWGVAFG